MLGVFDADCCGSVVVGYGGDVTIPMGDGGSNPAARYIYGGSNTVHGGQIEFLGQAK